jgi:anthranilate phosphoribosyltransferase
LKRVQPVRRALGFRTIFNLAGPLTNPAGAPAQVMGVFSASRVTLVAEAMARLGVRHSFVVHGLDGLDELTLTGESSVAEVRTSENREQGTGNREQRAGCSVRLFRLTPEEIGLSRASLAELAGGTSAAENAAILERVFAGEKGAKREIVLLNAAAALVVVGVAADFREGVARGAEAIDSGKVRQKLSELSAFAQSVRSV